jgi:hypothetical protein
LANAVAGVISLINVRSQWDDLSWVGEDPELDRKLQWRERLARAFYG